MSAKSESCPLCGWPAGMEYDPSKDVKQQPQPLAEQPHATQQNNYSKKLDVGYIVVFCCSALAALVGLIVPQLLALNPYRFRMPPTFLLVICLLLALAGLVGSILFVSKPRKAKASAQDITNVILGSSLALSAVSVIILIIRIIGILRYGYFIY